MKQILTCIFLCVAMCVQAQHKYDWTQNFTSNFKEDSVRSFDDQQVLDHIIYPIKKAIFYTFIEVRFYLESGMDNSGSIVSIQIAKDTAIVQRIDYKCNNWKIGDYGNGYEYVGKNKIGQGIVKKFTNIKSPFTKKQIIDSLNTFNVFSICDREIFEDSIKEKGVIINEPKNDCLDCYSQILCEIKLGNNFRNFYLWSRANDYFKVNESISYFKNQKQIIDFFSLLFHSPKIN